MKKTIFFALLIAGILIAILVASSGTEGKIPTPDEVALMVKTETGAEQATQAIAQPSVQEPGQSLPWGSMVGYIFVLVLIGSFGWMLFTQGIVTTVTIDISPLIVSNGEIPSVKGTVLIRKMVSLQGSLGRAAYGKESISLLKTRVKAYITREAAKISLMEAGVSLGNIFQAIEAHILGIHEAEIGLTIEGGALEEVNFDEQTEDMLRELQRSALKGAAFRNRVQAFQEGAGHHLDFETAARLVTAQISAETGALGMGGVQVTLARTNPEKGDS